VTPDSEAKAELVRLELPAAPAFHAVGHLVVGGLATRAELRVDQIEDLQLAVEALLLRKSAAEHVTLTLSEDTDGVRVTAGPFADGTSRRPGLETMLRTLVGKTAVQDSEEGEWISMKVARAAGGRESS
jgi:hypothetical protein